MFYSNPLILVYNTIYTTEPNAMQFNQRGNQNSYARISGILGGGALGHGPPWPKYFFELEKIWKTWFGSLFV